MIFTSGCSSSAFISKFDTKTFLSSTFDPTRPFQELNDIYYIPTYLQPFPQDASGFLCGREYPVHSCSHDRDCWRFLVRFNVLYSTWSLPWLLILLGEACTQCWRWDLTLLESLPSPPLLARFRLVKTIQKLSARSRLVLASSVAKCSCCGCSIAKLLYTVHSMAIVSSCN